MNKINDTPLVDLVPESISHDSTIQNSALALDNYLQKAALSLPDLLLYSRLAKSDNQNFLPPLKRLTLAKGGLSPLPLAWLEQFAWQFHLDFRELAKTDEELRLMILNSINWHRIKGTPKSILSALELFGYEANLEEHNVGEPWANYQIGLKQVQSLEKIENIVKIANEMAPARCKLFRIYTQEFDLRPAIYSELLGYSEVYYSFYSGLDYEIGDNEITVSLGRSQKSQTKALTISIQLGISKLKSSLAPYVDSLCYSQGEYSQPSPVYNGFSRSRLRAVVFGEAILKAHTWSGTWDQRIWYELVTIGRKNQNFSFIRQSLANSEAVFGNSTYSDLNSNYSKPKASLINKPSTYTYALYSEPQDLEEFEIDELFSQTRAKQSLAFTTKTPQSNWFRQCEHRGLVQKLFPTNHLWQGEWDKRKWQAFGANSNILHNNE